MSAKKQEAKFRVSGENDDGDDESSVASAQTHYDRLTPAPRLVRKRPSREHFTYHEFRRLKESGRFPDERRAELAACFLDCCPACHEAVDIIAAQHRCGRELFEAPPTGDVDLIGRAITRIVLLASQAGNRERQMLMPSHLEPAERAKDGMGFAQLVHEEALYVIDDASERALEAAIAARDFARTEGERRRGPWGGLERHGQVLVARAWLRRGRYDNALEECPLPRDAAMSVHGAVVEARAHQILADLAFRRGDEAEAIDHLQSAGNLVSHSQASSARLAEAYWELGRLRSIVDPKHAVYTLDAALALLPQRGYGLLRLRVAHRLARVLFDLGDLGRAEALLRQTTPLHSLARGSLLVADQAYLAAILAVRRGDGEEAARRIHDALAIFEERRCEPEETAALVVLGLLPLAASYGEAKFESDLRAAFQRLGRWPEAMTAALALLETIAGGVEREVAEQMDTWGAPAGNGLSRSARRMLQELKSTGVAQ